MEKGLPIGAAPNIHVSLVMLPEEGRYLVDRPERFRLKEMKLKVRRQAFRMKYLHDLEQADKKRQAKGAVASA